MIHNEKLLEPADYYENELKNKCKELTEEVINKLVEESNVDIAENRKTVNKYTNTKNKMQPLKDQRKLIIVIRILLMICTTVSLFYCCMYAFVYSQDKTHINNLMLSIVLSIFFIVGIYFTHKSEDEIKNNAEKLQNECNSLLEKAYSEMYPLNYLINQETILSIAHKTLPDLVILPYTNNAFISELAKLCQNTGDKLQHLSNIISNGDTTITSILSGTIDHKMYMYLSYMFFKMGEKTYSGSETFSYEDTYRDDDGKIQYETCYETLTAYITRPYPEYNNYEYAFYYSSACPSLIFERHPIGDIIDNEYALNRLIKKNEKKFAKQEKKALENGEQFTAMSDVEFETIFNTKYRNNDIEFRMMYTPFAIKNFIKLVKSDVGFKDNFSLIKNGVTTVYIPEVNNHPYDYIRPSANSIASYSYDAITENFKTISEKFFKDIYFTLSPMFMIPIYASSDDVDLKKTKNTEEYKQISTFDAENIAYLSDDLFRPNGTSTKVIHKAKLYKQYDCGTAFIINSTSFKEVKKDESIYVRGVHTSGYVDVDYFEYYKYFSSNTMLLNYIGLPDLMALSIIKSIDNSNAIKYTYINGFLAIKIYDIYNTKNQTILNIINTLRTKKGEENAKRT